MRALWDAAVSAAAFVNHLNLVLSVALEVLILIGGFSLLFFVVFTAQE